MTDMSPSRPFAAAAAAGLLSVLASGACSSPPPSSPEGGAPVPVTVGAVAYAERPQIFEAGGIVQARTTATLTARLVASVREVRVAPGDRVRAGQVLVLLDDRDIGAHARGARASAAAAGQGATAAEADVRAAEAALTLARASHQRIAGLHARRSATAQELDEATAALRAAEARAAGAASRVQQATSGIEAARAASDAASATESFTRITAPFDGVVTSKLVEPGNMAAPGMPLVRVEDTRGFRLEVRVDESRVGQVAPGSTQAVELEGPEGPITVSGRVSEIARAVDADARAFLVKVDLPKTAGLRSGMFGRARFAGAPKRVLAVPESALVSRGQVTSVFVVDGDVARLRLVDVRGGEVLAGLVEGEQVVVEPPPGLTDGRRVSRGGR